jgi:hypothetical protein
MRKTMNLPEPQLSAETARRQLRDALGYWHALLRWYRRLEEIEKARTEPLIGDEAEEDHYDREALIFALGDAKERVLGLMQGATPCGEGRPVVVLLDDQVLIGIPEHAGEAIDDTYASEGDGFIALPDWMMVDLREDDAA